ncbi:MAG: tripartite tricarboxylate transporter TctB family protein [Deltaproteobacteria bacterium]|nr:tripartite tricarboxylate transporter TctB family protein [Deltaproteobacteria bacterium]MBW1960428.1 tripartite tricarboxylate transporter TctB family protein [Deltaproteobacteria bacterium]MBW1993013.1 tripartite tricarboxylate transporter TctB family protein [Deltaproteobacteria bacterium]MBW2151414.1 tripartite tricarboxylate transporter TctB family protein [Deltaproteobacteria bacterium]
MNRDLRLGIILMVIFIALFLITFTFQYSEAMSTHTTAAFFPRVILVVLMFLTLLLIFQNLGKGRDAETGERMDRQKVKRVVWTMICSALFLLGSTYIGTLVSIALFITGVMLTWGVQNVRTIVLNALITPLLIYLVFTKILLVQLPAGILK